MNELDKVKGFLAFKILLKFPFERNWSLFGINILLGTSWDWIFKEDGLTIVDWGLLIFPILFICPILTLLILLDLT